MNILHDIAADTRKRVEARKLVVSVQEVRDAARALPAATGFPFEAALRGGDIALICEVKKASPSKGVIARDFSALRITRDYEAAGAAAISVLTEPRWFQGDDRFLQEIAGAVTLPLLRKDFIVDSYQIYEAKVLGASAVLLICSLLDQDTLAEYVAVARDLGLSALVEAHTEDEARRALDVGARVIGVNNRNLETFEVDITLSERLRAKIPPEVLFVAESGIQTPGDVARLRAIGADAALVGEVVMRSDDKQATIAWLKGACA